MNRRLLRSIAIFLLLCVGFSTSFASIITVPTGLSAGDHYRLAFVTSFTWYSNDPDINYYNNYLTSVANNAAWSDPDLVALGADWFIIGSTAAVDARDNTGTNPGVGAGVPIYNLGGYRIANNNADLWDGSIQNQINVTERGSTPPYVANQDKVWTGTATNGTEWSTFGLGYGSKSLGTWSTTSGAWIQNGNTNSQTGAYYFLYAMSEELTVSAVPIPAALPLFGSALGLMGFLGWWGRRQQA